MNNLIVLKESKDKFYKKVNPQEILIISETDGALRLKHKLKVHM